MTSPLAQALAFQNAVQPAQSPITPADILGAYKLHSDVAEKNYQAKLQQMQAMWGGLASLGAAGILGFGKPWATNFFGKGGAGAANGATPVGASSSSAGADAAAAPLDDLGMVPSAAPASGASAAADTIPAWDTADASSAAPSLFTDFGLTSGTGGVGAADLGGVGAGSVMSELAAAAPEADATGEGIASLFGPLLAMFG